MSKPKKTGTVGEDMILFFMESTPVYFVYEKLKREPAAGADREKVYITKRNTYLKGISNYQSVVEQKPALSLLISTSVGNTCLKCIVVGRKSVLF